jgi:Fic family protein
MNNQNILRSETMRVEVLGIEMTIPNKLIRKINEFMNNPEKKETLQKEERELYEAFLDFFLKTKVVAENSWEQKMTNAKKATNAKINRTREKIQNAINLLKLQGEEINPYRIAKTAKISYNTARKYYAELKF